MLNPSLMRMNLAALLIFAVAVPPNAAAAVRLMQEEREESPFSAISQIRFEKQKEMDWAWANFQNTIAKHSEAAQFVRQGAPAIVPDSLTKLPEGIPFQPTPGFLPPPVDSNSKELRDAVAKFLGLDPEQIAGIRVVVLPSPPIPLTHWVRAPGYSDELLEIRMENGQVYVGQARHYYRNFVYAMKDDSASGQTVRERKFVDDYRVDWLVQTEAHVGIGTLRRIAAFLKVREQDIASIEDVYGSFTNGWGPPPVTVRLKNGQQFEVSFKNSWPIELPRDRRYLPPGDPFGRQILQIYSLRDQRIESYTLKDIARKLKVNSWDILSVRGDSNGERGGFFMEVRLRDGRQFIGELGLVGVSPPGSELVLPAYRQGVLWMAESEVGIGTLRRIASLFGIRLHQLDGARILIARLVTYTTALRYHYGIPVFIQMPDGRTRWLQLRRVNAKDELGYDIYIPNILIYDRRPMEKANSP